MDILLVSGIDISHIRLVDLTRLADQAKPFYEWVESQFRQTLLSDSTLDEILRKATPDKIRRGIAACYEPTSNVDLPFLFDGIGRTYSHNKACYYFFSWLIRDAPQQRLGPLVQRIMRNSNNSRPEVEIDVLVVLITKYRENVKTFTWEAIREVIIDRLEGSRRSLKGHEKETIVRTALVVAIQSFFEKYKEYGIYAGVEISEGQVTIQNESYDVSIKLLDRQGQIVRRILVPIKTRETEGGGHSHLFTRDILSAINAARAGKADDFLIVVIVAKNWSAREAENLNTIVDHLVIFDISPSEFAIFDKDKQIELNNFIKGVLQGTILPKQVDGN